MNNLLITNPTNIRYLTGFVGLLAQAGTESRDVYLLLCKTKAFLFISQLYEEEAKRISLINSFLIKHFPNIQSLDINILTPKNRVEKQLETICKKENIQTLAFESENITVSEYEMIKKINPTLSPTQNRIEILRIKKFPNEIIAIKKAAKLTDECFTFIKTKIRKGVTESELAWEIESFIRNKNAQLAFSPIVAFGRNSSLPHYTPIGQGRTLSENDLILFDFGARVDGYCSDMTRMIFVGTPSPRWLKAYEAVLLAQQTAINILSPKKTGASIDRACRQIIEDARLPTYPHGLGHGVGLDIHESPRLTVHQNETLKNNMVVTVEPGTYIEGEFGIRIEDLLLITSTGNKVLSKSSKEAIILL